MVTLKRVENAIDELTEVRCMLLRSTKIIELIHGEILGAGCGQYTMNSPVNLETDLRFLAVIGGFCRSTIKWKLM